MELELFVTEGLGDVSYLLASGGEAVVVDPQRDVDRFLTAAASLDVEIRSVLETHVHNDYLSGGLELRAATGAEIGAPADGGLAFEHRPLRNGDELVVGTVRLRAVATPGHTPEHLAYVVYEEDAEDPVAVFSGGSLIVGNAGRTDLLGPDLADDLVRRQYRSLRRLAAFPPEARVLPTHGSGSFCASGPSSPDRTSTIGRELASNPALTAPDEATFAAEQLAGLPAYPAYYREMAPINRTGPAVLGRIATPPPLAPDPFEAAVSAGARVVDARPREAYAAGHIPGSVNVELDDSFASYVGWVVPFAAPVVLVLPEPAAEHASDAVRALARIGYERVPGFLEGGIEAWTASGRPATGYGTAEVADLCAALGSGEVDPSRVLDVRQRQEWDAGHVPGSRHAFVGDLATSAAADEDGDGPPLWVICASGHRASIAASLLDREGVPVTLVRQGGVARLLRTCPDLAAATG